ncbi:iron permease [Pseudoscardovia radai]|uniref:Iron permease n=1 Tax=Pseudoscardovia radai TaxID=987066 RepID=A0A261EUI2_9BIFI|nr:FTR1 family protein [Pseudoscardovia radai]OZG50485.1 iron permease [Pseudoscardovia radai]
MGNGTRPGLSSGAPFVTHPAGIADDAGRVRISRADALVFEARPQHGAPRVLRMRSVRDGMGAANRLAHAVAAVVLLLTSVCAVATSVVPSAFAQGTDAGSTSSSDSSSAASSDAASSGTDTIYTTATDADSWSQIADRVATELADAQADYAAADYSSAYSAAQRAYNQVYVASNLANAISTTDQASYTSQTQLFQTVSKLTHTQGNEAQLASDIAELNASVSASAAALDADSSVANPRDYAAQRLAQIQSERETLDANKKRVNNGKGDRTWSDVASEMVTILDDAYAKTEAGDGRAGSDLVNEAYYQYYEKLGFEKNVMNAISGSRVSQVENQFKTCRKDMVGTTGASLSQTKADVESLKSMLVEDAAELDGGAADSVSPWRRFFASAFGQAFIILLREGLEAILVVAAVIAYLVKTGNRKSIRFIYLGILMGLVASGIMAVILNMVYGASGSNQELVEGWTAIAAMVMLLFTGNWMLSKSSVDSWNRYVSTKTKQSVAKGSVMSLAMLSFLAVFREGAETVIFYEALLGMMSGSSHDVWVGAASAAVVLVIVFLLIRFTSVKIPIGPFFAITSAFMGLMVVVFAGGGLHELIEADVFDGTYVPGWPTNDFLGIYPYKETVAFQIVMLVAVVALFAVSTIRRRRFEKARAAADGTAASDDAASAEPAEPAAA